MRGPGDPGRVGSMLRGTVVAVGLAVGATQYATWPPGPTVGCAWDDATGSLVVTWKPSVAPAPLSLAADIYEIGVASAPSARAEAVYATSGTTAALGLDKDCDGPKDECSFNGAWGGTPGLGSKRVYLSSYLWDRAVNVGIVSDVEIDGRSSVSEF